LATGREEMKDASSQIRTATRRAKSDVANKLISMFLHELSRIVAEDWRTKVDSEEYERLVRESFDNRCPYCLRILITPESVIEHLDGTNRYRAGLHVPGNVLVACRKCNNEKRRDDSLRDLSLADFGWASFLSHDGRRCDPSCLTCQYWKSIWPDEMERMQRLGENLLRIQSFRSAFSEFEEILPHLTQILPALLTKLYADCQAFAETEIKALLEKFQQTSATGPRADSHGPRSDLSHR
jgi:hypothetical protein